MKSRFLSALAVLAVMLNLSQPVFADQLVKVSDDPNSVITRAGAVAVIVSADANNMPRVQWMARHMPPIALFTDIDQKAWYAPYLEVAFERGIITGNADALFHPEENLSQADAVALSVRLNEALYPDDGVFLTIAATEAPSTLDTLLEKANFRNVSLPSPFLPASPITRGPLFAMLRSAGLQHPETTQVAYIQVQPNGQIQPVAPVVVPTPAPVVSAPVRPITPPVIRPIVATRPVVPASNLIAQAAPKPESFVIGMPSLGISALNVSHPTDYSHDGLLLPLKSGVGHLFSYPGQGGKILVYGHSSGYPWDVSQFTKIFRQINKLAIGDIVSITYQGKVYNYRVTSKQTVPATDTSAYQQEGKEELVLYTCWPPDSIKQRYLVHAEPVEMVAQR